MPLSNSLFAKMGAHVGNDFDCPEDPRAVAEAFESSQALNDAARNLAANLLRVIAGAGKKHALIDEATALLKACRELQPYSGTDAYSYSPIAAIAERLNDLRLAKEQSGRGFPPRNRRRRQVPPHNRRALATDADEGAALRRGSRTDRPRAHGEDAQAHRSRRAGAVAAGLDPSAAQLGASMAADLDAALQAHAPKPR